MCSLGTFSSRFGVRTPRNGSARLCVVLDFWLSLSKGARKEGREKRVHALWELQSVAHVEDGLLNSEFCHRPQGCAERWARQAAASGSDESLLCVECLPWGTLPSESLFQPLRAHFQLEK